jgi:hypothetical protein
MLFIITPNCKGDPQVLADAAEILGWQSYIAPAGWRLPQSMIGQLGAGAVYGERIFCEVVAQQMKWKLSSNSLDWAAKLPKEYLHRDISFTKLGDMRSEKNRKFIKPADGKSFAAKVYESGLDLPKSYVFNDVPVIVSDVMNFTSEYRCFVKNRRVVSVCCYWYPEKSEINNKEHYNRNSETVIKFVNSMLENKDIECANGIVIDVGRYEKPFQREWPFVIMKSSPAYCSDVYGCEIIGTLETIKASCSSEENHV